jgi:hypothetical protein
MDHNILAANLKLIPWSRVFLEKLTVAQLVKKYLAFYGTRRFTTVFQEPATGPYPEPDQSNPLPPYFCEIGRFASDVAAA